MYEKTTKYQSSEVSNFPDLFLHKQLNFYLNRIFPFEKPTYIFCVRKPVGQIELDKNLL